MRVAFYSPLVPVDHASPSGDRQMARQFLKLLAMAGHDTTVVSRLRSWSRDASEQHLADLEQRAAAERARIAAAWQKSGAPDLWFTYHPYYKSPDLLGPALSARAGIGYVTAGASISIKRQEGEWQPYQAIVAKGLADSALNLYFAARDLPGLAMVTAPDRLAAFPPCLDIEPASRRPPQQPPTIVTVAMARPGRKLHNFRIMASVLARILELPWRLAVIGGGTCQPDAEAAFAGFPEGRVGFLASDRARRCSPSWRGQMSICGPVTRRPMAWPISRLRRMACRWRRGTPPASHRWCGMAIPGCSQPSPTRRRLPMPSGRSSAMRHSGGSSRRGRKAFALGERSMANGAARLGSLLAKSREGDCRMTDWRPLERELGLWQENGRVAALWLRDDDAEVPSPALDSLLEITAAHGVQLLLAIIPVRMVEALAERLHGLRHVEPAVHGVSHHNHAGQGEKKSELGEARSPMSSLPNSVRRASAWRGSSRPCRAFWCRHGTASPGGSRNGSARPASRRYRPSDGRRPDPECGSSILMSI
jgi:hypothetical protein